MKNEDLNYIIRIIKSKKNNSGVLINRVSETAKHKIKKKQESGFLGKLLGTLSASMLEIC